MKFVSCLALLLSGIVFSSGCKKNPFDRTKNDEGGALGRFGVAGSLKVFSDELFTGGGAFLYPGGENQTLSFDDQSNSVSARSIRYMWNGKPPKAGDPDFIFAGVDFMHTPTQATYDATPGRDLRSAGYTKVTFYARGSLSTYNVVKIEVADDGPNGLTPPCLALYTNDSLITDDTLNPCGTSAILSADWRQYTISVPNTALASVKDYLKATFVFRHPSGALNQTPGQGGTLYLDAIFFEP